MWVRTWGEESPWLDHWWKHPYVSSPSVTVKKEMRVSVTAVLSVGVLCTLEVRQINFTSQVWQLDGTKSCLLPFPTLPLSLLILNIMSYSCWNLSNSVFEGQDPAGFPHLPSLRSYFPSQVGKKTRLDYGPRGPGLGSPETLVNMFTAGWDLHHNMSSSCRKSSLKFPWGEWMEIVSSKNLHFHFLWM